MTKHQEKKGFPKKYTFVFSFIRPYLSQILGRKASRMLMLADAEVKLIIIIDRG